MTLSADRPIVKSRVLQAVHGAAARTGHVDKIIHGFCTHRSFSRLLIGLRKLAMSGWARFNVYRPCNCIVVIEVVRWPAIA